MDAAGPSHGDTSWAVATCRQSVRMAQLPVLPAGSYAKFMSLGLDESYLPVWLQVGV